MLTWQTIYVISTVPYSTYGSCLVNVSNDSPIREPPYRDSGIACIQANIKALSQPGGGAPFREKITSMAISNICLYFIEIMFGLRNALSHTFQFFNWNFLWLFVFSRKYLHRVYRLLFVTFPSLFAPPFPRFLPFPVIWLKGESECPIRPLPKPLSATPHSILISKPHRISDFCSGEDLIQIS